MAEEGKIEGQEGLDTGTDTGVKSEVDPSKPAEINPTPGDQVEDIRTELVKRYGERSDQDYVKEVFKSYQNMEKEYSKSQGSFSKLNDLVAKFGGPEALEQALLNPTKPTIDPSKPVLLPDIEKMVNDGYLDPRDPKDALLIQLMTEQHQIRNQNAQQSYEKAKGVFEEGLKGVAAKYSHADINAIRMLGYAGAFANLNDTQLWATIDKMAKEQHERVDGLVNATKDKTIKDLKGLKDTSVVNGKPTPTRTGGKTAREAFDEEYDRWHKD